MQISANIIRFWQVGFTAFRGPSVSVLSVVIRWTVSLSSYKNHYQKRPLFLGIFMYVFEASGIFQCYRPLNYQFQLLKCLDVGD